MNFLKLLGFSPERHKVRTELVAGLTTFLTMSYILAVNPSILSATGMDKGAVFTATALASAIGTILIAFFAKLPFAQAPSMGINAFFAFTLVLGMGYSWEAALTAVFVEGIIFILLTAFNIREQIVRCIPKNLRFAISAGIGMFIAFIGLKNAGIIVANEATFVTLGKFTPTAILASLGIVVSAVLIVLKVRGALFYGIIICTLAGIPLGVTNLPDGFVPISTPQSLAPTFLKFVCPRIHGYIQHHRYTHRGGCQYRNDGRKRQCEKRKSSYDGRCGSNIGRGYARYLYGNYIRRECLGYCRGRAHRSYFVYDGYALFAGTLLLATLPAHTCRCYHGGVSTGWGLYVECYSGD